MGPKTNRVASRSRRAASAGGLTITVAAATATAATLLFAGTASAARGAAPVTHQGGTAASGVHARAVPVVATVAGGAGGPAKATRVAVTPCGASSAAGFLYVAALGTVRKVSLHSGGLTTPAGTGAFGPDDDGGLATRADLDLACGATLDHSGNLVIADTDNCRIRVVAAHTGTYYGRHMIAGRIYSVAGIGTAGFSGDGGPATKASLNTPGSVAVDGAGNLVIADTDDNRIRVVAASTGTYYGQAMTAEHIYTIAGTGTAGYSGDGGPATSAKLNTPGGAVLDSAGNLVIADTDGNRIRVVAASTGTHYGQAMTAGNIYTVAGNGAIGFSGDGGPATSATLYSPQGVAVDGAGNLVIADTTNERIRVVAAHTGTYYRQAMTAGDIYTVAGRVRGYSGDGGPATRARLDNPGGVTADGAGNLVIADTGNYRVRVVAASTGTYYGRHMAAGNIYTVAGNGTTTFSGNGGPATGAELNYPGGVAADGTGDLVIADSSNNQVRVVPASTGTFYGQAMTAKHIYAVAGTGTAGYSGDGGPGTHAGLSDPGGVTADGAGNLVIADTHNERIRVVAAHTGSYYGQAMTAGNIYTVAGNGTFGFSGDGGPAAQAQLAFPSGVTVDGAGNLVIDDTWNQRIRVVAAHTGTYYGQAMTAGDIYTVAGNGTRGYAGDGGPATSAEFYDPGSVAVDSAGNLVIADWGNGRIRVVAASAGTFYGRAMTAGDVYTVAGDGTAGFSGDGGPATKAALDLPEAATVDGAGNLVIADTGNNRIRVVAASTGTFYGKTMTAEHIYTVAGTGTEGFSGDGGPAARAEFRVPDSVAADGTRGLVIADAFNNRIREMTG